MTTADKAVVVGSYNDDLCVTIIYNRLKLSDISSDLRAILFPSDNHSLQTSFHILE